MCLTVARSVSMAHHRRHRHEGLWDRNPTCHLATHPAFSRHMRHHYSVFTIPSAWRDYIMEDLEKSTSPITSNDGPGKREPEICPALWRTGEYQGGDQLQERSLCPWNYTNNHDPNRYPIDIPEAVPLCHRCRGLSTSSAACQPIFFNMPVFRRTTDSHGRCTYHSGWQRLALGYACSAVLEMK